MYSINVRGTFLCTQAAAIPDDQARQRRLYYQHSSVRGKNLIRRGQHMLIQISHYRVNRGGSPEFGKYRIAANAILPGATNTKWRRVIRDVPG